MKMKQRILLAVVILTIIVPLSGCKSKFQREVPGHIEYYLEKHSSGFAGYVTYKIPCDNNVVITVHEDRTYDELIEDLREDEDALKQFLLDRDSWVSECVCIKGYLMGWGFPETKFIVDIWVQTADDQMIFHVSDLQDFSICKDLVQDMIDAGEL